MHAKALCETHAIVFTSNGQIFVGELEIAMSSLYASIDLFNPCQIVQNRQGQMSLAPCMMPTKRVTIIPSAIIRLSDMTDRGAFEKTLQAFYAANNSGIVIAQT